MLKLKIYLVYVVGKRNEFLPQTKILNPFISLQSNDVNFKYKLEPFGLTEFIV